MTVNLIIADDHTVLRQALAEMLGSKERFNILAEASDGNQLLQILDSQSPDIVILDMSMPNLDGLGVLERLSQRDEAPPVLILSANEGELSVRSALKAGAKGFVPKNAGSDELEFAIDSILKGQTYLSPAITTQLMAGGQTNSDIENPLSVLTKRELEILSHLADGKPNRQIGKELHISTRTVDTHRSNILKKLEVKTNAELVKIAIANGLIEV